MNQHIIDMILEITPKCVHHIEILPPSLDGTHRGQAICRTPKNSSTDIFVIKTPSPLKSVTNLLIFLHECAHITLGHIDRDPNTLLPIHPHYNTYFNEITAWAKVDRWFDYYDIVIEGKKALVQVALEHAWATLHTKK